MSRACEFTPDRVLAIQRVCAAAYGVSTEDLCAPGPRHTASRDAAYYLVRSLLFLTQREIARQFNRSQTSVFEALERVSARMKTEPRYAAHIDGLRIKVEAILDAQDNPSSSSAKARASWANQEVRQRRIAGIRASWTAPGARDDRLMALAAGWAAKVRAPDVPAWVPSSLAGEYVERALEYDEFDAAKHIRSLLRETK